MPIPRYAAIAVICMLTATPALAEPSFGSVQHGGDRVDITWETPTHVELSNTALRFTQPGTSARSQPLPLRPQHYYRITTKMARGPGSTAAFSIVYRDANNKLVEWAPSWQHKSSTHPNWLPLSPRPQRYVQGFVLPLGATQPRLHLRLDAGDKTHSRWELTDLLFEETQAVTSCHKLSEDLLLGGDFDGAPQNGLPPWWTQWSKNEHNHVELITTASACKQVLRVKPQTTAIVASNYTVAATRGSAYRLSLRARGHGRVELDVHSLSRDRPVPLRVGNASRGTGSFEVNSETWTPLQLDWYAEAPNIASAQVVIAVAAQSAVELDAVELRACEGPKLSSP